MFYDTRLLSKTGRLGEIWLIANQQKIDSKIIKIVLETDIHRTIQTIMESNLPPLSLRLYAYLLHGVIKLYHHKVVRLYEDASKSLSSINAYRTQKEDSTKKTQARKDTSTAITMKDRYHIDLDLTIPDIAGLDIMEEMDLLDDANIAPHTAITFGELEEHIEDDSSQIPLLTPSVQDYLGDFDPHHYSPDTTDISIEQPIEEQQTIDETTEKITAIDESIDIGDIDVGPMDVSMEIPQRTQITDIFEGGEISSQLSQIVEVEEDDEQKNADKNDLVKSHKPRTIVIRPDKTSILSQRKVQGNVDDYRSLTREIEEVPPPKRRRFEEDLEDVFSLPNLPFENNLNNSLIDLLKSSFNHISPFKDIPRITPEEEEEIEAARRASSVAPPGDQSMEIQHPADESFIDQEFEPFIPEEELVDVSVDTIKKDKAKAKRTLSIQHGRSEESPPRRAKKAKKMDERFESVRTQSVHSYMGKLFKKSGTDQISFQESLQKKSKSTVSQIFYELLVLKSLNVVDIQQDKPQKFSDIYITKTVCFFT